MPSIIPSVLKLNEGESLTTSLSGYSPNSTLYFQVSGKGVDKKDFAAGGVKGSVKVDANGVATISHTLKADKATEGSESLTIQVFSDKKMTNLVGQSDAVTIADTSKKAVKGISAKPSSSKDIITGKWEIDTLGTLTKPPGGIFYRINQKEADKSLRFGDDVLYRDLDSSMTFTSGDAYLGRTPFSGSTTGKTGSFTQNSVGSSEFSFFADALGGAKAGEIVFTTIPW